MPHYVTAVKTAWGVEEAFGFMADVRNFGRWDPGVRCVSTVHGDGPGLGSAYDVEVRTGLVPLVLRYEVVEWEAPCRLLLVARTRTLQSVDEIRVEPAGAGAVVTCDARLDMRGALRVASPLLKLAVGRIGDRAAAGLRRALGGEPPRLS
jgi:dehydrogenase/reductase SDR family protein 12